MFSDGTYGYLLLLEPGTRCFFYRISTKAIKVSKCVTKKAVDGNTWQNLVYFLILVFACCSGSEIVLLAYYAVNITVLLLVGVF